APPQYANPRHHAHLCVHMVSSPTALHGREVPADGTTPRVEGPRTSARSFRCGRALLGRVSRPAARRVTRAGSPDRPARELVERGFVFAPLARISGRCGPPADQLLQLTGPFVRMEGLRPASRETRSASAS